MEIEDIINQALIEVGVDADRTHYLTTREEFNEGFGDDQKFFPVVILDALSLVSTEQLTQANHIHSEYPNLTLLFLDRRQAIDGGPKNFDDTKKHIYDDCVKRMRALSRQFVTQIFRHPSLKGTDSLIGEPTNTPLYNLFDVELSGVMLVIGVKIFDNVEFCDPNA